MKTLVKYSLLALLLVFNCKDDKPLTSNDKVVISFKKEGILTLKKATTDALIKTLDIEIANNPYETQTGLMYRTKLEENQAMLFIFLYEEYKNPFRYYLH